MFLKNNLRNRASDPFYFEADPDPWIRMKNMDPASAPELTL